MNLPILLLMPAISVIKEDCFQPKDKGTCRRFSTRFFFNSATGHCEEFTYGGCDGNRNNFLTVKACQETCLNAYESRVKECNLPLVEGGCDASFPRYYFNVLSGTCEKFIYRGCNGNLNNFLNYELCQRKCVQPTQEELQMARCESEPDPGPCMAEIKRFFYSPQTNNCFSFTYGGCGGNTNNYNNMDSCLSSCRREEEI